MATIAEFKAAHLAHLTAVQSVIQAEQATGDTAVNMMAALGNARAVEQNAAAQRTAVFRALPALAQNALATGTTAL